MSGDPSRSEVLREVERGSTQENLTAAANALKRSRNEENTFTEGALQDLDLAIKAYNQALQKSDLVGMGRTTVLLQLGKAHTLRGMAEYSPYTQRQTIELRHVLVQHHAKEAARYFQSYLKALGDPAVASQKLLEVAAKMIETCDRNVDQPRLRYSLSGMLSSHLLGGETTGYEGPRLPRVRMEMYVAKQCFLQAVRILCGETHNITPVFSELKQVCIRPQEDEDSLLIKWRKVQQQMMTGKTHLIKVLHHITRSSGGGVDSQMVEQLQCRIQDLTEQMKFLLQRSLVISRIAYAAKNQRKTLQDNAEFDMGACYEVIDEFREAEAVADKLGKSGVDTSAFESCLAGMDVEMLCIASHFTAKLFTAMGLDTQARERHKFVLCTALSMDPEARDWGSPTQMLSQKPWFMESKRVVEEAQTKDREAEEKERQDNLQEISAEVKALMDARLECNSNSNTSGECGSLDPRPLMKHLLEKHTPLKAVDQVVTDAMSSSEPIKKAAFMKFMALYHPDKLDPNATKRDKLLRTEIMTVLNGVYDLEYK